jgi:hypothetical protein
LGDVVATPGFGVRYYSPVGPIRVDAAFNASGAERLSVLTTGVEECLRTSTSGCRQVEGTRLMLASTGDVVRLDGRAPYAPLGESIDSWGDFFGRFQLHFSIGQAF